MKEIWKDVVGYEGHYKVSNLGRIKSIKKIELIIKTKIEKNGYERGNFSLNGKIKMFSVHRVVAEAFIDNPKNKLEVNHKDGVKVNNNVQNLEWVTNSENEKHKYEILGYNATRYWLGKKGSKHHSSKSVLQYNIDGSFIKEWGSIQEVKRELGIDDGGVSKCCKGNQITAGGYVWRYKQD